MYESIMRSNGNFDEILCQDFPTTFKRIAQTWFYNLPEESVGNFEQLILVFLHQKANEPLRKYITCFNNESLDIPEVTVSTKVDALSIATTMSY